MINIEIFCKTIFVIAVTNYDDQKTELTKTCEINWYTIFGYGFADYNLI